MKKIYTLLIVLFLVGGQGFAQSDECATALLLNDVSDWCSSAGAYNNNTATTSTQKNPGCWTDHKNDVWFKFVAVKENITITITGDGASPLQQPQVTMYFNDCAVTPETDGCKVADPGQNTVSSYKGGMVVGQEYLIRVHGANSARGTFSLCAKSFDSPAAPGQDCQDATYLCSKDPVQNNSLAGWGSRTEVNGTCMYHPQIQTEKNVTWFYWECGKSGTLTFDITPKENADIDFVLFELPNGVANNCMGKTDLRCVASGSPPGSNDPCTGPTGLNLTDTDFTENFNCDPGENHYAKYIDMVLGKKYALFINNFNNQGGFLLEFGGTGEFLAPKADFTATPQGCNTYVFTGSFQNADNYVWNFGPGASPATANTKGPHTVTYSSGGTKTVGLTVKHSNCEQIGTKQINVGGSISADITATPQSTCGNTFTISTTTDADSYSWNFGTDATPSSITGKGPHSVSFSSPGTKSIKLDVSKGGCNGTQTKTVTVNTGITASAAAGDHDGCDRQGAVNGKATVTVNGGSQPYNYSWDDPQKQTTATATGLPVGTYNVKVTDANNCEASASVSIKEIIQLNVVIDAEPSCPTCNDGKLTVQVNGTGQAPYTYRWNDGNQQTTQTATGLAPGTYEIAVTDNQDCRGTAKVTIGGVGIEDKTWADRNINIFPNPTQGNATLELNIDRATNVVIEVYDVIGERVSLLANRKFSSGSHLVSIDPNNLHGAGIYFVRLHIDGTTYTKKLILSR